MGFQARTEQIFYNVVHTKSNGSHMDLIFKSQGQWEYSNEIKTKFNLSGLKKPVQNEKLYETIPQDHGIELGKMITLQCNQQTNWMLGGFLITLLKRRHCIYSKQLLRLKRAILPDNLGGVSNECATSRLSDIHTSAKNRWNKRENDCGSN
jgi:hypothetical protein